MDMSKLLRVEGGGCIIVSYHIRQQLWSKVFTCKLQNERCLNVPISHLQLAVIYMSVDNKSNNFLSVLYPRPSSFRMNHDIVCLCMCTNGNGYVEDVRYLCSSEHWPCAKGKINFYTYLLNDF